MFIDTQTDDFDWIASYKVCTGLVAPRPIALVSTVSPDGVTNLAPFSFFNMISANPPVVVLGPSIKRDGARKDTLVNIEATGEFVIATVTRDIAERMARCAAELPYGQSEFDFAPLTPAPARRVRPPLVAEAAGNLECRLRQIIPTGDTPGSTAIVLGDILAVHVDDRVLDAGGAEVDPRKLELVGRLGGKWYCTVRDPFELPVPKV